MDILQVCAYAAPYPGNFIRSLLALEQKAAENGHRTLYAFPETARKIPWCEELAKHAKVYFLPLSKARIRLKTYIALHDILNENPDIKVIHSHFELYDFPIVLVAPKNIKVFWHLHDAIQSFAGLKNRLVHRVQYGLIKGRAQLLSVAEENGNYAISCGFPKEHVTLVPNAIDLERIQKVDLNRVPEYDFLIFGWELERKGVDLCFEAVRRLKTPIKVVLIAKAGVKDEITRRFGHCDNIDVCEPISDVNLLYCQSKAFLHISRAEGQSYALIEAIYAGLPALISDIPENMFATQFGNVFVAKSEDANDIAKRMEELLDATLDPIASKNNRQIIEEKYSTAVWANRVFEIYGI